MKKILAIVMTASLLLAVTACSTNGKSNTGGVAEDAGNAVNDVLNGAEDVVDDVTGSDKDKNAQSTDDKNMVHENDADQTK